MKSTRTSTAVFADVGQAEGGVALGVVLQPDQVPLVSESFEARRSNQPAAHDAREGLTGSGKAGLVGGDHRQAVAGRDLDLDVAGVVGLLEELTEHVG